jgi:hypothetical protein
MDGTALVLELTNRLRFETDLKLDKNRDWQDLTARVTLRPITWEIHSAASEKNIHLKMEGGANPFNVVLNFSDLQNPAALTSKLLGPAAAELTAEAGLPAMPASSMASPGLKWEAFEDTLRIGHTSVQVYRLHTRLLDRYEVNATISRAGEILRVQLPNDVLLQNDRLSAAEERTWREIRRDELPRVPARKPPSAPND